MQDIVFMHAQRSLHLLEDHQGLQCPWRYQDTLQMFSVLHFCDALARFYPHNPNNNAKNGAQAVQFGLDVLTNSTFPVARTLQALLHRTAVECSLQLAGKANEVDGVSPPPRYNLNDMIDACTRPTYTQPIMEIHSKIIPSFPEDWKVESPAFHLEEHVASYQSSQSFVTNGAGHRSLMDIQNLLNDPSKDLKFSLPPV